MKIRYLLISLILLATSQNQAQNSLGDIMRSSRDFETIVDRGNAYFSEKHPGLSPQELTQGTNRDGEYVKFQRWQSFWRDRLDDRGRLADISAFHRQPKGTSRNNPYANVAWTNISYDSYITGQIGLGRTTSLGFHPTDPNTWYVGAAIGGVWKTTDNGQTYTPLGDELPFLAVSSIVVDQDNPNTVYIAISDHLWYGPPGIGVYKSTNGGGSWQPTNFSLNFTQNDRIYWLEADPSSPNTMIAATQGGLYRTTDGFNSVSQINGMNCYNVRFHPTNSNIVYLGTNDGRFLRSTNNGVSFSQITDFGSGSVYLEVSAQNSNHVYARVGNQLHKSTNSGQSFTLAGTMQESNEAFRLALTNDNIIVSGNFEMNRSNNNGGSFSTITHWLGSGGLPLVHVDHRNLFTNPLQPDYVYSCNDGGVYRYRVSTGTFENLCDGLEITQFYDIAVSQSDANIVGGGSQDNGNVYRTSNGQWLQYASTGDGMNQDIDPTDSGIRFWAYQLGALRRWSNGFNNGISPPGQDGNGAWETPFKLDPSNPNRLIAAYDKVYESMNQGSSWSEISGTLANGSDMEELAIAPTNGERIYVLRGSSLWVKDVDSDNWTAKSLPSGSISDIEVDFQDMDIIYISRSGYSAGNKVWRSNDAGDSWTNISGDLPNVSTGALELVEGTPGGVLVGNDNGVYYRDEVEQTWHSYGDLPNTRVEDIEIQYSAGIIRVGTHGRGVLEAPLTVPRCEGSLPDNDEDGICDFQDICPDFDNGLIGEACDDEDEFSQGEVYVACECRDGAAFVDYCTAAGSAGTGADWISRVQINTIDNGSGKTAYSDFRELSTRLDHGSTHPLTVTFNYAFEPDRVHAWADFDRSGTFDADEAIAMSTPVNNVSTGDLTVPLDAVQGAITLRVRGVYSTTHNDPCGNAFGEVEDYSLRLMCTGSSTNMECGLVVPVVWTGFQAKALSTGQAQLNWQIEQSNELNYFVVQRSIDGQQFESIGQVAGSNEALSYQFQDRTAPPYQAYYRIHAIDFDGSSNFSPIKAVSWDTGDDQLELFPNPTEGSLRLSLVAGEARIIQWQAWNLQGKVMLEGVCSVEAAESTCQIQVNRLAAGTYFIRVKDGGLQKTARIVKM